jgi:hypothetical protein
MGVGEALIAPGLRGRGGRWRRPGKARTGRHGGAGRGRKRGRRAKERGARGDGEKGTAPVLILLTGEEVIQHVRFFFLFLFFGTIFLFLISFGSVFFLKMI